MRSGRSVENESVFARIEFGHLGDEFVDEDLNLRSGVLDPTIQIGINEQGGNGNDEAGDGR